MCFWTVAALGGLTSGITHLVFAQFKVRLMQSLASLDTHGLMIMLATTFQVYLPRNFITFNGIFQMPRYRHLFCVVAFLIVISTAYLSIKCFTSKLYIKLLNLKHNGNSE